MRTPEKLNSVGLKATRPRLVVLNVFREHDRRHLSAEDVYRWLVERRALLNLATVYRVLNQLTEGGLLARTVFDAGPAVYELHSDDHHNHLICCDCGRVDEFTDAMIDRRWKSIAKTTGYAVARCQLALYGRCPACVRRKPARTRERSRSRA